MKSFHTIHTPRLILRTPQLRDAPAYFHLTTNPENQIFDPSPPSEKADSVGKYERCIWEWRENTRKGVAASMVITLPSAHTNRGEAKGAKGEVEEKEVERDVIIGMAGFNELGRKNKTSKCGVEKEVFEGNIGALIDSPTYIRKGYGKEALKGLIEYGFEVMGCDFLTTETLAINLPFRALMDSFGLGEGKEVDGWDRWGEIICEAVWEGWKENWKS